MHEQTPNLRDVGGTPTHDGRLVARHRVLRSAAPGLKDVAPDGIAWPPSLVIDLRSPGELESIHPLAHAGSRVVNLPLLSALRPDSPYTDLSSLYLVLLDHASMHLVELVREVGLAQGATLIHCAAGKDRTGVSVALLLRLVGVQREHIVADYLRTAEAEKQIAARLKRGRRLRTSIPAHFFEVPVGAIEGVLDVWDDHDGGVEGWFLGVGGDQEHIDQLRRTLLT